MHADYVDRVRELLAEGELSDAAFDQLLPPTARAKSMLHWTPLEVARRAAERLAQHGARCVLDAGSGAGKFCVVAASSRPHVTFVGIEQRARLVSAARTLADRLEVMNARFELGDALGRSWAPFDGFYCFNPFAEPALGTRQVFGRRPRAAAELPFETEATRVSWRLREARRGSVLVTYHGLGGVIPSSYELMTEEDSGSGSLRTWVKTRDREEDWVYLDYGAVSRASWRASTLAPAAREHRHANPASGDVSLKRSGADLQLGRGPDRATSLGLQSGLDDLVGQRFEPVP